MNDHFTEALKTFTNYLENKTKSNSTLIAYKKDVSQLLEYCYNEGLTSLKEITIKELEGFKSDLKEKSYTAKSISRKINAIRTFLKWAESNKLIKTNPGEKLAHPKFETKAPRILSEIEYRSLRDLCRADIRLYSIVEILLQTGIRISELANLYLEDIKQDEARGISYLYIREFGSHPSRKVPINGPAKKAIEQYIKIRPECEDDHLFVTKNGNPLLIRNIRTAIDKAFEKAGIQEAKVNDLRNTFIAHHLKNGVNLLSVSKVVGHKRISTTEKYLELIKNDQTLDKTLKEL